MIKESIFSFLKIRKMPIIIFTGIVVIFGILFYLYDIPFDAIIYGCELSFVWCAVCLFIDFYKYYKRHKLLHINREQFFDDAEQLPEHMDIIEYDYQELAKELYQAKQELISKNRIAKKELLDYYGMWVHQIKTPIAALDMLRNKKSYYYKTRHFTAVSGMIYRMKQNAVGLANICILSTMVLVMVSMTVSLYGGLNDVIVTRFPYEAQITSSGINQKEEGQIEEIIKNTTRKNHTVTTSQIRFHVGRFTTVYNNKTKQLDMMAAGDYSNSNAVDLVMIPLSDYNQTEGKNVKLKENEVLLYHRNHKRTHKKSDTEALKNKKVIQLNSISYKVVDELDRLAIAKADTTSFIDGWYVVVKDSSIITSYLKDIYENSNIYDELKEYYGKIQYSYSFNLNGSRANRAKTEKSIQKQLQKKFANCSIESRELSRESFYELYGGFLFIGIFLGIIFLMATTLIIYYKQISEGYDDRERYQIMQKVGMSKKEVRHSIRSQVLLVFFLPLIMAVIHLAFAFKIITKLLSVLNLTNISLFFMYTVGTVAVFAVIYAIIYSITAREYYKIIICRGE